MAPPRGGGPMGRGFLTEEEKANRLASELPHMRESREVIQPLIGQGLDENQIDENIRTILLGDGKGIW